MKPEDFGKLQYGSKLMNVTFDPTVSSEFASYAYDDGGLKAEESILLKEVSVGGLEVKKVRLGPVLMAWLILEQAHGTEHQLTAWQI